MAQAREATNVLTKPVQESQPPGKHQSELTRDVHGNYPLPFHVFPGAQEGHLVFKLEPTVVVYNPFNNIVLTAGCQRCGPSYLIAERNCNLCSCCGVPTFVTRATHH